MRGACLQPGMRHEQALASWEPLCADIRRYESASSLARMLRTPAVPPMGPGAMPLTRMPNAPHSSARLRVRLSTAALAAEACAWPKGTMHVC